MPYQTQGGLKVGHSDLTYERFVRTIAWEINPTTESIIANPS